MVYIVAEYASSVVDALISVFFLELIFGFRTVNKKRRYPFIFMCFLVSHYLAAYLVPQMICAAIIDTSFCFCCLKGKKYEHVVWSLVVNVVYCAMSSVLLPILAIVTGKTAVEMMAAGTVARIWLIIIQKLVVCLVLWVILIYKNRQLRLDMSEKVAVILLLFANIFTIGGFYVINVRLAIDKNEQVGLLVVSALIVIILIYCIILITKISSKNKQMLDNQVMSVQIEGQSRIIKDMRKNSEEVRILRHDLKYYAMIIKELLVKNDTEKALQELERYIEKTTQADQKVDYVKGNDLINVVLHHNVCECDRKNIRCEVEVTSGISHNMEMDVAIMLANILDNAVRAEEGVADNKRYIRIEIGADKSGNVLRVTNYIEESVMKLNPQLITTKEDKELHSWGIKSVRNITEKYGGELFIKDKNNEFEVMIKGIREVVK